jgi:hypothetical protein
MKTKTNLMQDENKLAIAAAKQEKNAQRKQTENNMKQIVRCGISTKPK